MSKANRADAAGWVVVFQMHEYVSSAVTDFRPRLPRWTV